MRAVVAPHVDRIARGVPAAQAMVVLFHFSSLLKLAHCAAVTVTADTIVLEHVLARHRHEHLRDSQCDARMIRVCVHARCVLRVAGRPASCI
jgi:hypothetical protein